MKRYIIFKQKKHINNLIFNKRGMEMVQVAILVAIAIGLGMLFRERISDLYEIIYIVRILFCLVYLVFCMYFRLKF